MEPKLIFIKRSASSPALEQLLPVSGQLWAYSSSISDKTKRKLTGGENSNEESKRTGRIRKWKDKKKKTSKKRKSQKRIKLEES